MVFDNELKFESAVVELLKDNGWGAQPVLRNVDERVLIKNWAKILFENNRGINQLNDCPLTTTEMAQIISKVDSLNGSVALNGFINGMQVVIKRDNPNDVYNYGKEVYLNIYNRNEIAGGKSRYQIVEQPIFRTAEGLNDRRGDILLLINGMPVFHIELKRSCVGVYEATEQIKKYSHEGIFDRGIFSLVQIFVAMTPDETLYFANPGRNGTFNKDFFFHWADFNNDPINDWKDICVSLLSIPMAHQMIGFYTVADNKDNVLKVMRSYQYQAAYNISQKVSKANSQKLWDDPNNKYGGYVWHTTGSGKTLTSFKSAQLIANSRDADKVVFIVDRIELGNQSLAEYKGFADDSDSIQGTEHTTVLIEKLKDVSASSVLIVTSIQKMSNIKRNGSNDQDIDKINKKRLVFIVDEAHRSTFGDMLATIRETFPKAMIFGFTGTPIIDENSKDGITTAKLFGNELHRYQIADGIRDGNVLGFSIQKVLTFKDKDLRMQVALQEAKAKSVQEVFSDSRKLEIFNYYMNVAPSYKMVVDPEAKGKGIEDFVPVVQYQTAEHRYSVVNDIIDNFLIKSQNNLFHAIFATSSISDAIAYYRIFKKLKDEGKHSLNFTALFDASIDNNGEQTLEKEDALRFEILEDYNQQYNQHFTIPLHHLFKKDVSERLAHKSSHYQGIKPNDPQRLDLLIVVDQMLTGFDSKYVNTLYLDKYWGSSSSESIIQAFSRTNRVYAGSKKPFGFVRYYRYPHTMEKKIYDAFRMYSGSVEYGVFASDLLDYLDGMNILYTQICDVFRRENIPDFDALPSNDEAVHKFVDLFNKFNKTYQKARAQGFIWSKSEYDNSFETEGKDGFRRVSVNITQDTYYVFVQRYKEVKTDGRNSSDVNVKAPFDIDSDIIETDTLKVDSQYMNTQFTKYRKAIELGGQAEVESVLQALHSSFASLSREDQKFAYAILNDFQNGSLVIENDDFYDYIEKYKAKAVDDEIHEFAYSFGDDETEVRLRKMLSRKCTLDSLNTFGEFDYLRQSVQEYKASQYIENKEGTKIDKPSVYNRKVTKYLKDFIFKNSSN